jgi:hypothetical protein
VGAGSTKEVPMSYDWMNISTSNAKAFREGPMQSPPYDPNSDVVLPEPHDLVRIENRSFTGHVWVCSCEAISAVVWASIFNAMANHAVHVQQEKEQHDDDS